MLSHTKLLDMYRFNFTLMQDYGYSLTELENMIPWEREIYSSLLTEWIEDKERQEEGNG